MMTPPLTGYPKDFTIVALIYQVSLSSQQSSQTRPYALIFRSWIVTQKN
jgi:hypothetical protein